MAASSFLRGQLVDFTAMTDTAGLGTEYDELFSAATAPTLQAPPPDSASSSSCYSSDSARQGRAGSSQPSSVASSPPSATASTKSRKKVRPHIALAPDQPPTARGNDRIRVYVACHECRARKVRCDGAKPICFQCQKRPTAVGACTYDAMPNRRGHDRRSKGRAKAADDGAQPPKRRRTAAKHTESSASPTIDANARDSRPTSEYEQPATTRTPMSEPELLLEPEEAANEDDDNTSEIALEEIWEYDPFAFDIINSELLQFPPPPSPSSPQHSQNSDDEESIPSRPSVQFARDTWWDALLAFYASERDPGADMSAVVLTAEQRSGAVRHIVSDLRALFQSSASWMSFIHLPRFFQRMLDPVQRAELQPSLLLAALALGILTQSSEVEMGRRGRERAMKLLDMAHGALQSSLATGWVDVGLPQAGWMLLYFELNAHPRQSSDRTQSALTLLDSLVRLFSLTTIDAGYQRVGGPPLISSGHGFATQPIVGMNTAASIVESYSAQPEIGMQSFLSLAFSPSGQGQFAPQPDSHAFEPPIYNSFYTNTPLNRSSLPQGIQFAVSGPPSIFPGINHSFRGPTHPDRPKSGCDCAQFSLGNNWSPVREYAPTWSSSIMWPMGLSEAEFRKEECRRLVWGSVMMIAGLNAYASITPDGVIQTSGIFVREHENFALLTPSETLARSGVPMQADDVWSLSLRAMLLLHSCLRVRASRSMSSAERAEFAVRAWLEIDDIERRLERHTCGMSTNYGFQSTEMLFSLRICVSYEFQRFIPQITTTGNALFYRDKAETWLRHLNESITEVWEALRRGEKGDKELDHRKSLFIFWYMSGIKKCIILWEADNTLLLALTTACQAATYLEHLILFWPSDRVRAIWQKMRFQLVEACLEAGVPPPSPAIPRPIPRREAPLPAAVSV
ncbi:hypothetical protein BD414DRAFT_480378 [Trametes punicea]|nr:hypothetical protein BD414DRAFT_480378 [Trametes punicea]